MERHKYSGEVIVSKIEFLEIKALNKIDAVNAAKSCIGSEDEIVEVKSERNIYRATIKKFVSRDY